MDTFWRKRGRMSTEQEDAEAAWARPVTARQAKAEFDAALASDMKKMKSGKKKHASSPEQPPTTVPDDGHVPRERVRVDSLTPHPLNYKGHPDDQIEHIVASIRENGVYRNVVVARDGMILAGHGVCLALKKMGREWVDVVRLDVGPMDARALKVLAGDNEIGHLGEVDDRALSELLKTIQTEDVSGLLGTGYDDGSLDALLGSLMTDFDAGDPVQKGSGDPVIGKEYKEDVEKEVMYLSCPFCEKKWPK